ncbi:MAG: TlpA family protein disulfide reductase [Deltaproteobacteria bacterium]|nr:MAG: TlpA family protein disulfide reductase [Deltaproteobacteria bacterium]
MSARPAPPWSVTEWINTDVPLSLDALRGKAILLHAFQMLCPGCIAHGIPQAQKAMEVFKGAPLAVVGLHTVFEHHDAMTPTALRAFVHEYGLRFPIGIDAPDPSGDPIPRTMRAYGMRGTPTAVLIDARGRIRKHLFGRIDDMVLARNLEALVIEASVTARDEIAEKTAAKGAACGDDACVTRP